MPTEVAFAVSDRGLGIPPDQIDLLFRRFSTLPSAVPSDMRGVGLGLYICRHHVEAMGGRLWVRSEIGEGSTFAFALPRVADPRPEDAARIAATWNPPSRLTVGDPRA